LTWRDRGLVQRSSYHIRRGCNPPCEQAVNDPSDPQTVIVNLGRALGSGTNKVSWHMISIISGPTSRHIPLLRFRETSHRWS